MASTSATPTVTFELLLGADGSYLPEEHERLQAPVPGQPLTLEDLSGRLLLAGGPGGPIELPDQVEYLAARIGLGSVAALRAGQALDIMFYEQGGGLAWQPEGDEVLLLINGQPQGRFARAALADALLGCVQRLARCFQHLAPGDSEAARDTQATADALLDRAAELTYG